MSEPVTMRWGLPLLQPAQAQKHVTVNEALMRLDGLVNLVLQSTATPAPPTIVIDGECWAVPAGAVDAWAGRGGSIAIGTNGGWTFATPQRGQRAFVVDQGANAQWTGATWAAGSLTMGSFGGGMNAGVTEGEVQIAPGTAQAAEVYIPANTLLIGVTGRVTEAITGTLTSWTLGVAGAPARFGSGIGLQRNSWSQGLLSAPMAFYAPESLRLTAAGGAFAAGRVRLSVHWLALRVPDPVA